jgi:hypothetical protein
MRVSSSLPPPDLSNLPVDDQIDAALMAKAKEQLENEGALSVALIDSATASTPQFENRPLNFGSVGRRINIAA